MTVLVLLARRRADLPRRLAHGWGVRRKMCSRQRGSAGRDGCRGCLCPGHRPTPTPCPRAQRSGGCRPAPRGCRAPHAPLPRTSASSRAWAGGRVDTRRALTERAGHRGPHPGDPPTPSCPGPLRTPCAACGRVGRPPRLSRRPSPPSETRPLSHKGLGASDVAVRTTRYWKLCPRPASPCSPGARMEEEPRVPGTRGTDPAGTAAGGGGRPAHTACAPPGTLALQAGRRGCPAPGGPPCPRQPCAPGRVTQLLWAPRRPARHLCHRRGDS